ncbi:MAG: peptidylprolyl isomerase [Nitrosopumilus sp.]|nr:peptidylprolyl isomerase [Nitrosopumilus sp.]MDH3823384.1 peptidylprolyl isomerase [Nitrosopumilus sp.]MDH3834218.1 peptidylprolyl isomerase [Nitrosopumilus sp.]
MKIAFLILVLLFFIITPVYGQLLSDATGLVKRLDVQTGGNIFEVKTVSNFDITNFDFDDNEKRLTLHTVSGLENNLSEIIIPLNLLGGNLTFYLNEEEIFPKVNSNEKISFITLNFTGLGNNKLEIIGTTYLDGLTEENKLESTESNSNEGGGCLIATATYGSELAPEIQQLRELRDNSLLQTQSGTLFMSSFNDFYYSFSPIVADYERENPVFKETVRVLITPMIFSLSILNYVDMNSESGVIGYGISLILLNIGIYFIAPVIIIAQFHKLKFY